MLMFHVVLRCLPGRLRRQSDLGATAVEYSLLVGLITAVIFAAVVVFGQGVLGLFNAVVAAP